MSILVKNKMPLVMECWKHFLRIENITHNRGVQIFFWKEPDGKYFRLPRPNDLCHNYSTLPLLLESRCRHGWAWLCPNKTYLWKWVAGKVWAMGHSLPTLGTQDEEILHLTFCCVFKLVLKEPGYKLNNKNKCNAIPNLWMILLMLGNSKIM